MTPEAYAAHDATGLAALVRGRQVTAREVAEAALACIERLEPRLAALVAVFADDVAGIPRAHVPSGAFAGVPFLIKDCLLTMRGKPVLNGSRLCGGLSAASDTELMKRFRRTGVTVVGMSKCPEFGYNATTEPLISGPVHNPWRAGLSPGGSSGGAAAAVAAGYVPIAHGNDGGGSIRIPASACGLVGLKPTRGRNPLGPALGEALFGMSCEGIVSRTVRDTALMLECTSGPDLGGPYQITPLPPRFSESLGKSRARHSIAVAPAPKWAPAPAPEISAVVSSIGHVLIGLGHNITLDEPVHDPEALSKAISTAWVLGETAWIKATAQLAGREPGPGTLERTMWNIYREGMALGAVDAVSLIQSGFNAACRAVAPFFERYEFLVLPTVAKLPLPHGTLNQNSDLTAREWWDQLYAYIPYTPLFNVTGQPAISLPLGESADGLPIGVQIVARFGEEAALLSLAAELESACRWQGRRPAISIFPGNQKHEPGSTGHINHRRRP
jgi:amidase